MAALPQPTGSARWPRSDNGRAEASALTPLHTRSGPTADVQIAPLEDRLGRTAGSHKRTLTRSQFPLPTHDVSNASAQVQGEQRSQAGTYVCPTTSSSIR